VSENDRGRSERYESNCWPIIWPFKNNSLPVKHSIDSVTRVKHGRGQKKLEWLPSQPSGT
jgi:hypothetical protein